IRGARPIERAVAQHRAVGLEHGVLEMADRIRTPAHYRCRLRVERVLFGLHPSALADAVPTSVTLRDEVGYTGRLGRSQQVVRALGAQPDGGGEPAVDVLEIGLACVRHG